MQTCDRHEDCVVVSDRPSWRDCDCPVCEEIKALEKKLAEAEDKLAEAGERIESLENELLEAVEA